MTASGPPVPLSLLTGFLGAGKTTLLNRLLREPALDGTAVIINEFGAIGIDHLLVERVEANRLMLTTGCICCAARGDLVTALEDLMRRRHDRSIAFDRIVVETTGLADPRPILEAVSLAPALRGRLRAGGVLTVVDARDGLDRLSRSEEAVRQVALADTLILSKTDLIAGAAPDGRGTLEARLHRINPLAGIVDAQDLGAVVAALAAIHPAAMRTPGPPDPHHHHPHAGIVSAVLRAGVVEDTRFEAFLTLLMRRYGENLLRLKGFVATPDDPSRPHLVEVVGRRLQPGRRLDGWPDAERATRLVIILDGVPGEAATELWASLFGPVGIDRPDAAALTAGIGTDAGLF